MTTTLLVPNVRPRQPISYMILQKYLCIIEGLRINYQLGMLTGSVQGWFYAPVLARFM
ncbi:MAG: hypothetical protein GDA36_11200 [Rhodobacteraceae bacterium]|nr:hypothetical protein [Paracoccaceae bacterium]